MTHGEALAGLLADPRRATGVLAGGVPGDRVPRPARRGRLSAPPRRRLGSPDRRLGVALGGAGRARTGSRGAASSQRSPPASPDASPREPSAGGRGGRASRRPGARTPTSRDDRRPAARTALSDDDEPRLRNRLALVAAAPEDAVALLLVGLVRAGRTSAPATCAAVLGAPAVTSAAAEPPGAEIADVDEDRAAARLGRQGADGFFTTFFVSPYSKYIARWAARRGFTPNQVTTVSMRASGVLAAIALRDRRALGPRRRRGAAADRVHDRLRRRPARPLHAPVLQARRLAGLGVRPHEGVPRVRGPGDRREPRRRPGVAARRARRSRCRPSATCPTSRSAARSSSALGHRRSRRSSSRSTHAGAAAEARRAARPSARRRRPAAPAAERVLGSLAPARPRARVRWVKRMIAFPIGERFAVISITAALFTPRSRSSCCSPGAASRRRTPRPAACCGRCDERRRSRARSRSTSVYRDDGPLARALGATLGRGAPAAARSLLLALAALAAAARGRSRSAAATRRDAAAAAVLAWSCCRRRLERRRGADRRSAGRCRRCCG